VSAPKLFAIGDEGQSEVLRQPAADELRAAEEAVANCPTAAILLET
jgi:ferredoxin